VGHEEDGVNATKYREAETKLWASVGASPGERTAPLKRWDTEVRVQDVGEGEPVVLIHGGPNAGTTWAPLVGHLQDFRCLVVDRPGTGLSSPLPLRDIGLPTFADHFVGELLDGLDLEHAHVVASSLGGYLALRSAASNGSASGRIDRMVLMGAPPFVPGMTVPSFMRLMMIRPVRGLMTAFPPSKRATVSILKQMGHGESVAAGLLSDEFFEWDASLTRDTDTMRNDGNIIGMAGSWRGFNPSLTVPEDLLRSITTPTLLLWGDQDPFGSVGVGQRVASLLPNATLDVRTTSGHLPWLDDERGLANETAAFLRAS
jgi:4,5:9,10-diseco-3-hydroxy-5,9,17-trioxoandrosta-1(10),2-diene-4-oate hydrolase